MNNKKIFIGLGNPGPRYVFTRHNVGFLAIDHYVDKNKKYVDFKKISGRSFEAYETNEMILIKPLTFMNLSGQIFQETYKKWGLFIPQNITVIYDDVNFDYGIVRIRKNGSAGSHNGMKSIISVIGSNFPRIRIGIDKKPDFMNLADYVLKPFTNDELSKLGLILDPVCEIIDMLKNEEIDKAMNKFNSVNFIE
jgi:PTH1 family peptidyl-tRNA hydrolase